MKPAMNSKWNPKETRTESLKKLSRKPHARLKYQTYQTEANTMQMRGWSAKIWQMPCKMEGEHGQM